MNISNKVLYLIAGVICACLLVFSYTLYRMEPKVVLMQSPCAIGPEGMTGSTGVEIIPTSTPTAMLKKIVTPVKK